MRILLGLLLAVLVNYGLFTLMQKMISPDGQEGRDYEDIRILEFVRLQKEDRELEIRSREKPEPPPPPEEPPPPPPDATAPQPEQPDVPQQQLAAPRIDVPMNITGGPHLGSFRADPGPSTAPVAAPPATPQMDGEVVPLVRVPPNYPRMAQRRGIEGVVTVAFTITADGSVKDPVVVSAEPESVFDDAAIAAILKWKFKPRRVAGEATERRATQEIEFRMAR